MIIIIKLKKTEFRYLSTNKSLPIDSEFLCKKLPGGWKACKTTVSLIQCQKEISIGLTSILLLSCQECVTVMMIKTST